MDVVRVARETGASAEDVRVLAEGGLDLDRIVRLMADPACALSWETTVETSDNVTVEDDGTLREANWRLVFPPSNRQVQSGTAFARHLISARGRVRKEQGGWPH